MPWEYGSFHPPNPKAIPILIKNEFPGAHVERKLHASLLFTAPSLVNNNNMNNNKTNAHPPWDARPLPHTQTFN